MMDLLKDKKILEKEPKKRIISTTGIEIEDDDNDLREARGIKSISHAQQIKDIEEADRKIREKIALKNKEEFSEDDDIDNEENKDNESVDDDIEKKKKTGKKTKKIDIKRYKDPEGLTLEKMEIGLWLVKHRRHMIFIFYSFLALIGIITWGWFFYTFGHYILVGMKEDANMEKAASYSKIIGHEYFASRAPKSLKFQNIEIIKGGDNYDIVVNVINPNEKHWAHFDYHFEAGGKIFGNSSDFILPGESKYMVALNQELPDLRENIKFIQDSISWTGVNAHKYPKWENYRNDHLNIYIAEIEFTTAKSTILSEKLNLNDLKFIASNNTPYNYHEVDLTIILLSNNKITAVTRHVINGFMSGETKNVSITWPGFFGNVSEVKITPDIDITRNDIYYEFEGEIQDNEIEREVERRW